MVPAPSIRTMEGWSIRSSNCFSISNSCNTNASVDLVVEMTLIMTVWFLHEPVNIIVDCCINDTNDVQYHSWHGVRTSEGEWGKMSEDEQEWEDMWWLISTDCDRKKGIALTRSYIDKSHYLRKSWNCCLRSHTPNRQIHWSLLHARCPVHITRLCGW